MERELAAKSNQTHQRLYPGQSWRPLMAGRAARVAIPLLQRALGNQALQPLPQDTLPFRSTGDAPGAAVSHLGPEATAGHLIDWYTSWTGDLDESALGHALLRCMLAGDDAVVEHVLDALDDSDRDDVAYALCHAATDQNLDAITAHEQGRVLLNRLYDEMTAGYASGEESREADRLLQAKARLGTAAAFEQAILQPKIFPFRLPGLTVLEDAPLSAERRANGMIWAHQPVRVLAADRFRRETSTLPLDVFTSGLELPANEIVGVKMYDLGGEVHYRPALYLIHLAHRTDATIMAKMGEAATYGLSLGAGSIVGWTSRAIVWADRAAAAAGLLTSVIREHRGWIVERFSESGRTFLSWIDRVTSAVALYGGVRAIVGMVQMINALRVAYGEWKAMRQVMSLSADEGRTADRIAHNAESFFEHTEQVRAAQSALQPAARPVPDLRGPAANTDVPVVLWRPAANDNPWRVPGEPPTLQAIPSRFEGSRSVSTPGPYYGPPAATPLPVPPSVTAATPAPLQLVPPMASASLPSARVPSAAHLSVPPPAPAGALSAMRPVASATTPEVTASPEAVPISAAQPHTEANKQPEQITLRLPAQKAVHAPLYRSLIRARRLVHIANKSRDSDAQADTWDRALRPGGMMPIDQRIWNALDAMDIADNRKLRPDWSKTQDHVSMHVDHQVELQVCPRGEEEVWDSFANYELLDEDSNISSGSQLKANIVAERSRLAARTGNSAWLGADLVFTRLEVMAGRRGERWSADEIQQGKHYHVLRWLLGETRRP
ncbi:MAG TPA: hypothetical protein VGD69_01785 [Herpetosiphonaceae bacterium]